MSHADFKGRLPIGSVPHHPDYFDLKSSDAWSLDLRYATTNNFLNRILYRVPTHFLHREAGERLVLAAKLLRARAPTRRLLILDTLRPASVQLELWAAVEGTSQEKYIANPRRGSIHSFGFAIDLTLIDEAGRELDMGTPFDEFDGLAEPQLEREYLASGMLTETQINNRHLLRDVMLDAGFAQLPEEWWHFDALPQERVRRDYVIID